MKKNGKDLRSDQFLILRNPIAPITRPTTIKRGTADGKKKKKEKGKGFQSFLMDITTAITSPTVSRRGTTVISDTSVEDMGSDGV